jgi:hypothetical protein
MPFAYYARLTRAQQAVYRKSDGITEIRLPHAATLHPLVGDLHAALRTEQRLDTQRASDRLIRALTDALAIPPVKVEVLAARPHAKWGELHGLYTAERGKAPKIQLWMRTAKQKRVVAFRTYMRTLLHEVGHHIDYALLRLPESYHTEGFYKRESSLFYQLVPEAARPAPVTTVRSVEQWSTVPVAERLERLERTPAELARLMRGHSDAALSLRPAADAWSAKEVVCHLRDAEEHLAGWMRLILASEEPVLVEAGTAARWADDRQYARHHAGAAWDAFGRWRDETLALLRGLTAEQWQRSGHHHRWHRMTVDHLLSLMAWHDDNHVDQLRRALDGQP